MQSLTSFEDPHLESRNATFFRRFCISLLMDHGISSEYRNNMAGWKGGIADKHYTNKKRQAAIYFFLRLNRSGHIL